MNLNHEEMQAAAAANPALIVVSCSKDIIGTELDANGAEVPQYGYSFIEHPANFKLHADPFEVSATEIYAVLEDLDYAKPA